jgi:hypothetical protein
VWGEQYHGEEGADDESRLGPVHPNCHIYAKMALNLMEKIAPATDIPGATATGNRKRTWSASYREDGESSGRFSQDPHGGGSGSGSGGPRQHGSRSSGQVEKTAAAATAATSTSANRAEEAVVVRTEEAAAVVLAATPGGAVTASTKPPTVSPTF